MKKYIVYLIAFLLFITNCTTTFASEIFEPFSTTTSLYVSMQGNDSNSGLHPNSPLKSISKAISIAKNNTAIYIHSGDIFWEPNGIQIIRKKNIILTSYGGNIRPIITGLIPIEFQKTDTKNIYSAKLSSDIGYLYESNKINWKRKINPVLENDDEYYVDIENQHILLRSEDAINSNCIYYSAAASGIDIKHGINISISNLEIQNYGKHGIIVFGVSNNILVENNVVHDIGGALIQGAKYGNGIQCWLSDMSNVLVTNNTVFNCFDAGITPQITGTTPRYNSNIRITNNEVYNCFYSIEYFNSISVDSSCANIIIDNNYLHNCLDITDGYRETSNKEYGAFFCLWHSRGKDSVLIKNNVCIQTTSYAISYKESNHSKIIFLDNIIITPKNDPIKNPKFYSGINDKFIVNQNISIPKLLMSDFYHYFLEHYATYYL